MMLLFCAALMMNAAASVNVSVREIVKPKRITYAYRVENRTKHPIVAVRIGYDSTHEQPQLSTLPAGWTFQRGLARDTASALAGWSVRLVTTEENPKFMLGWTSEHGPKSDIAVGKSAGGFRITLPHRAPEFRRPMFEILLRDGTRMHGTVELDK